MVWTIPQHRRDQVNKAACVLIHLDDPSNCDSGDDEGPALDIINNWRSAHNFPLNTFQNGLRHKAKKIDADAIVAQRLKRLSSIAAKLRRFPEMKLSQMQDIGGCRAIVGSVGRVKELVRLYEKSDLKHKLVHKDDYIQDPKDSGYRSVHLVYRYFSDRNETYNGLKIEIQLPSLLQHAWATAVETVGTFIQQALKSSRGQEDWLRFFALMGSAIALKENSAPVPNTPYSGRELREELRDYVQRLDVENHLRVYASALSAPERIGVQDAHYFLLELDPNAKSIRVTGYKSDQLEKASEDYLAVERRVLSGFGGRDAVLVSVESFAALKRAYPNYFLDTHRFIKAVKQATGRMSRRTPDPRQPRIPFPATT